MKLLAVFCALVLAATPLAAQEPQFVSPSDSIAQAADSPGEAAEQVAQTAHEPAASEDFITPHISNSNYLELPYWKPPFHYKVYLPQWEPLLFRL